MSIKEKKIITFVEKNVSLIYLVIITILAIWIRYIGRDMVSSDMKGPLMQWFNLSKEGGGFKSLSTPIGDYNILYMTLIAIMTYLPFEPIYMYKFLSCVFDFLIASYTAIIICEYLNKQKFGTIFNLVYTTIIFLPTIVINSAYWGQCDSMYTFTLLVVLRNMYKKKYKIAFLALGVALSLKLQTVFILPFIIIYYFVIKSFSILNFLITLMTFWASGIPAYIYGRSLLTPFLIYKDQSGEYLHMFLSSRTFWLIFSDEYEKYSGLATALTIVLCGLGCYIIITKKKKMNTLFEILTIATWFEWICIFFLPAMHDRYAYPLDILLVLLAFLNKKYIKFAVLSVTMSFISYAPFLNSYDGLGREHALIELFMLSFYTYMVYSSNKENITSEIDKNEYIDQIDKNTISDAIISEIKISAQLLDELEIAIKQNDQISVDWNYNKQEYDNIQKALNPVLEEREYLLNFPSIDEKELKDETIVKEVKLDVRSEKLISKAFKLQKQLAHAIFGAKI